MTVVSSALAEEVSMTREKNSTEKTKKMYKIGVYCLFLYNLLSSSKTLGSLTNSITYFEVWLINIYFLFYLFKKKHRSEDDLP